MSKVHVANRYTMLSHFQYKWSNAKDMALISISTPGVEYDRHPNYTKWGDVIELEFDDVDRLMHGCIRFDANRAKKLIEFIEKNKDRDFAVHCDAGISRSPAVGMFISEKYGHDLEMHSYLNTEHHNKWVLKILKKYT